MQHSTRRIGVLLLGLVAISSLVLAQVVPIPVTIDIKPGSERNPINPRSNGTITVAILTTETFDATTVDPESVRFGPGEAAERHGKGHIEDVDGDGDEDLVLHFRTREAAIVCGETAAGLTGLTETGETISGFDGLVTVGCK
jgi:hypothetical protein